MHQVMLQRVAQLIDLHGKETTSCVCLSVVPVKPQVEAGPVLKEPMPCPHIVG